MDTTPDPPEPRHVVTVRCTEDPEYAHEVDVTGKVGTSSYDRVLAGLYLRVDVDRGYYVDSEAADAEHWRREEARGG